MKDASDEKTIDFIDAPKKRGRPVTGKAMTAAQRKSEQRKRDRQRVIETDLVRDWTKKDCLVVLNDPRMTIDMQRMAVRQLNVLLNCDNHEIKQ